MSSVRFANDLQADLSQPHHYFDDLLMELQKAHHAEVEQWKGIIACEDLAMSTVSSAELIKLGSSSLERESTRKHGSNHSNKPQPSSPLLRQSEESRSDGERKSRKDGKNTKSGKLSIASAIPIWLQKSVKEEVNCHRMSTTDGEGPRGSFAAPPDVASTNHLTRSLLETMGIEWAHYNGQMEKLMTPIITREIKGAFNFVHRKVRPVVENFVFDYFSIGVIVINSVMIGWRTHEMARDPTQLATGVELVLERACLTWFFIEVCLRLLATGSFIAFVCRSEKKWWNIFDMLLSTVDVCEFFAYFALRVDPGEVSNLSEVRLLRMMRIWRTFRIVRLFTIFQELRIMMLSLLACGHSLFWSLVMLGVIIYLFGVFFIQVTAQRLSDGWGDSQLHNDVRHYCDGLHTIIYYLFQAMSGGMSWGILSDLLIKIDFANGIGMIFFIFFTMFAVMNIITGIFVHNSLRFAMNDTDEVIHEQLTADDSALKRLREVFEQARKAHPSLLSYSEFEEMINQDRTRALLDSVGLKTTKIGGLFKLMDLDNSGYLSIDEFLLQCMRLRGEAKAVDLVTLMAENKRMMTIFQRVVDMVQKEAEDMKKMQRITLLILEELQHIPEVLQNVLQNSVHNSCNGEEERQEIENTLWQTASLCEEHATPMGEMHGLPLRDLMLSSECSDTPKFRRPQFAKLQPSFN